MATPTIRNLDAPIEEVRAVLAETVVRPAREAVDLSEAIRCRLAPLGGAELEPHPPVAIIRPWQVEERKKFRLTEASHTRTPFLPPATSS